MAKFIAKRVGISLLMLLLASVIMFVLTINSGDPLKDLRESNDINRENRMNLRTSFMGLDRPWYSRYLDWLAGAGKCFTGHCDFGVNRNGQSVNLMLSGAAENTIRLVVLSTALSIIFGITFGVLTAIRQYAAFDYAVTFAAFVFYSLPSFVFAVLLKEYGAIQFNDWLADPVISIGTTIVVSLLLAVIVQAVLAGSRKRRLITAGVTFTVFALMLQFFSLTAWFIHPMSGWFMQLIVGVAAAVLFTSLLTGIGNRKVLRTALITAGITTATTLVLELTGILWQPTWLLIGLLVVGFVAIGGAIGYFFGGYAKQAARSVGMLTAGSIILAMICDFVVRHWSIYLKLVNERPIHTIGSVTPNFRGTNDFWLRLIDGSTHLVLPTLSLTLISLASYTRYTRSSMLDVLNQDYMRTARAKGLPERTVILRHAFRNAMIPITTIVAFDFAGLIGGAVITESIFGWTGMGAMFRTGLDDVDPGPVMAFFAVTGSAAVLMNMVADILYAVIDPRIRR